MNTGARAAAAALLLLLPALSSGATRLYWFVPDGLRADPAVFDVFRWAREGKLPHIKRMMEQGAWGYSIPVFPSHTPTNFATLMTGAYPERHGIADGPMRVEGRGLERPSVNGFSSTAKKVAPIWRELEAKGLRVALLSIPGSTPPELDGGATVRGRWGNWGADFHALNFQSAGGEDPRSGRGLGARLFYLGPELTREAAAVPASGWSVSFRSAAPPRELALLAYGATVHAFVAGDARDRYSRVELSLDKERRLARLERSGQWSEWFPLTLSWQGRPVDTRARAALIRLSPDGFVKLRLLFDVLNPTIVQPAGLAETLGRAVGPMVDFPDNWPAQLNRLPEEREVLLSEARMALDWHRKAAGRLLSVEKPDVLIQDTYVPNQMLESRWWLRHVDPESPGYAATPPELRERRRAELLEVYKGVDAVLGEAMKAAGPDALIVLSSDHGVLPIKKEVLVNNLLAKEGLLFFSVDPRSGEPAIDWAKSRAAFLKMIGVYVDPKGLHGPWSRGSGPEYEALRARVAALLSGLRDGDAAVVERVVPWERAEELRLPKDRVPDLILAMSSGYALTEDMDATGEVLRDPLQSGYKQAVLAESRPGLWTPFLVMGPGVRKGLRLEKPVSNADHAPTLLSLLGLEAPAHAQGRVLEELRAR